MAEQQSAEHALPAGPRTVAFGGGHGLAAALTALRRLTGQLTAVVTVADDGGSSGRLRREFGIVPPGDLRMALAALCSDDDWGRRWASILQHRFGGRGELHGHAVGNLIIAAVWEQLGTVEGLDLVGQLLGAHGRVLPMSTEPLTIAARIEPAPRPRAEPSEHAVVVGQAEVARAPGRVLEVSLLPIDPPACPEALTSVQEADVLVMGPGSWFSSVVPHLLVPELSKAIVTADAVRVLLLNLPSQDAETSGYAPHELLDALRFYAPALRADAVVVDPASVGDEHALQAAAGRLHAEVVVAKVSQQWNDPPGPADQHDPDRLTAALADLAGRGRMPGWR